MPKMEKYDEYLVTGVTLGDGHIRHEIPVEGAAQRRRPLADDHLGESVDRLD
jgi:hypothetical protein